MSALEGRLRRLEHALYPEPERSGWCCTVTDPEDADALPPDCPHGRHWLVMFTNPIDHARYPACHADDVGRSFTIRVDRANADEVSADA